MFFLAIFSSSFILSLFLTIIVKKLALKFKIVDLPKTVERKIHKRPVPLLGGVAIFVSFFLVLAALSFLTDRFWLGYIEPKQLIAIFLAASILMIGGFLDDKFNLKPFWQTFAPNIAAIVIVLGGITISFITNPFGGVIDLVFFQKSFDILGFDYMLRLPADLITIAWMLGLMYTTKLLDGLDGLVSSLTVMGALIIFAFTLFTKYYQPDVALLAIILAGAAAGFLIFNWHPAKIFLGEGGSLLTGFMLGVVAIISGGKIATTLLVIGIPFFDMIWVILRRVFWEHRSVTAADDKHLHFRLLKLGLSQNQVVIILNILPAAFGVTGLYLQSKQKIALLGVLLLFMMLLAAFTVLMYRHKHKSMKV